MWRFVVMPLPGKGMRNRPQQIQIRKGSGVVRGQIHLPRDDVHEFLASIIPPQVGLTRSILDLEEFLEGDTSIDLDETLARLQRYHSLVQGRLRIEGKDNLEVSR